MINTKTPLEYIEKYYEQDMEDSSEYKEVSLLYNKTLDYVIGKKVLNVGCGPQFYNDLKYFHEIPKEYFGIDINKSTFDFLENSKNYHLIKAKEFINKNKINVHYVLNDIFEFAKNSEEKFNTILGVGCFGIFEKEKFKSLMKILHKALKKGGRLVDVSWYEPHLPKEEIDNKKKYYFESFKGPNEKEFISFAKDAKFKLIFSELLKIENKEDYQWGKVQGNVFEKI
jgi:SAM-dependent methyltransferase